MRNLVLAVLLSASAPAALAQTPATSGPPCARPEYRQLDFWAGEWKVFQTSDNSPVGSSRIETQFGGCSIKESYDAPTAPGGAYAGTSYSGWDSKDGKWRQLYVDTNGNITLYTGGLEGADLAMTAPGRNGATLRMVYRPQPDGSVRQIGTVSTDGGKTWKPGYDYTYRRAKVSGRPNAALTNRSRMKM